MSSKKLFRRKPYLADGNIQKKGDIFAVQTKGGTYDKQRLYLKVIKDERRHCAKFYTDIDYSLEYGCINLTKCSLHYSLEDTRIEIRSDGKDCLSGSGLTLKAMSAQETKTWVDALSPTPTRKQGIVMDNKSLQNLRENLKPGKET